MAGLDRLGAAKEVAQLGAIIGREFSYELIHSVSLLDEGLLQQGLKQLVEAELVYPRGLASQTHYLFKHALIQDTAYHSLLKRTRKQYHQQIAQPGALCQQLEETPQLFVVLHKLVVVYINRAELQTTRELAEQMMRLAQRVQDPHLLSVAHEALGCTFYYLGELSAARTHVEQAMVLHDPQEHVRITMGTADRRLNFLSYAAWTLWQLGYPDQALAIVDKTGMRVSEAELYRIYGELALRMGEREKKKKSPICPFTHSSPEECFLKAIDIARQQQAKSLELRAVMSLVRLRLQHVTHHGSRTTQHETRTMLSEIYGWFTEGFDTQDLQEAKALLAELAGE